MSRRLLQQLLDGNQVLTSILPAGVFWIVVLFTTAPMYLNPAIDLTCHTAACAAVTGQAGR